MIDRQQRPGWVQTAASYAIRGVLGLFAWSLKVEVHGWEHIEAASRTGRPVLFVTWHGHILSVFMLRLHVQLPLLISMISRSRDGDLASEVSRRLGGLPVRGSSSRGGAQAVLAFRTQVRREEAAGRAVAALHLLDGPRGPRHQTKPGVLMMARQNNALIVPVLSGATPCRYARSWDRHAIPLPFSRCSLRFGEAIDAGGDDAEDILRGTAPGDRRGDGAGASVTVETLDDCLKRLAEADPIIAPTLHLGSRR